jgi:copper(I)-binding protein
MQSLITVGRVKWRGQVRGLVPSAALILVSSWGVATLAMASSPAGDPKAAVQAGAAATVVMGSLTIDGAWARASMAGMKMGAGYLTIANTGAADDELLAVTSPAADEVQIHRSQMQDGVMRMREVGATSVPAGQRIRFLPGGLHLMFMGLKAPLEAGQTVPVTLQFREAGEVTVSFEVRSGR